MNGGLGARDLGLGQAAPEHRNWEDVLAMLQAAHEEEIPPAVYAAVRGGVLAEIGRGRKWPWVWAGGLAAVIVLGVAVGERMRVEAIPLEARAVIPAAELRKRPMPARIPAWRAGGSLHHREEIVMKIETLEHPDVVIYWIAEAKGDE